MAREHDRYREADALGPAFLGLQLHLLLATIDAQGNALLHVHGCRIRSRLASTLMLLHRLGPLSVTDLGRHLGMSHQLVAHRVKALRELGLVVPQADPADRRRTLVRLTRNGASEAKRLGQVCEAASGGYRHLFQELRCDVFDAVVRARRALDRYALAERAPRSRRS